MYLLVLLYVVFLTPNRYEGYFFPPNFVPLLHTIERIHKPAGERFFIYYFGYWGNVLGNIILFMPFSFLLSFILPAKRGRVIFLYGVLTSVAIEITQYILQIGVCDIDDLLLNATGVLLGVYAYRYWCKK